MAGMLSTNTAQARINTMIERGIDGIVCKVSNAEGGDIWNSIDIPREYRRLQWNLYWIEYHSYFPLPQKTPAIVALEAALAAQVAGNFVKFIELFTAAAPDYEARDNEIARLLRLHHRAVYIVLARDEYIADKSPPEVIEPEIYRDATDLEPDNMFRRVRSRACMRKYSR